MLQRGEPIVGVVDEAATIDGIVDWFGPEGERLLEERRTMRIQASGDLRVMDQRNELRAACGEVTLGDTKDAGILSLRVATSMDAIGKGRIENSEGLIFDSGSSSKTSSPAPEMTSDFNASTKAVSWIKGPLAVLRM